MATGTIKTTPLTTGTPSIISGSGASLNSGAWAYLSWAKYGQIVIVTICGLRLNAAVTSAKSVLTVPYRAAASATQTCSKDSSFNVQIYAGSNEIQISNAPKDTNLLGQIIYMTDE